jgi:hypothetical protein
MSSVSFDVRFSAYCHVNILGEGRRHCFVSKSKSVSVNTIEKDKLTPVFLVKNTDSSSSTYFEYNGQLFKPNGVLKELQVQSLIGYLESVHYKPEEVVFDANDHKVTLINPELLEDEEKSIEAKLERTIFVDGVFYFAKDEPKYVLSSSSVDIRDHGLYHKKKVFNCAELDVLKKFISYENSIIEKKAGADFSGQLSSSINFLGFLSFKHSNLLEETLAFIYDELIKKHGLQYISLNPQAILTVFIPDELLLLEKLNPVINDYVATLLKDKHSLIMEKLELLFKNTKDLAYFHNYMNTLFKVPGEITLLDKSYTPTSSLFLFHEPSLYSHEELSRAIFLLEEKGVQGVLDIIENQSAQNEKVIKKEKSKLSDNVKYLVDLPAFQSFVVDSIIETSRYKYAQLALMILTEFKPHLLNQQ